MRNEIDDVHVGAHNINKTTVEVGNAVQAHVSWADHNILLLLIPFVFDFFLLHRRFAVIC